MLIYHCSGFQSGKASGDWWQTSDAGNSIPWNGTCSYIYHMSQSGIWNMVINFMRVMALYFMSQN